MGGGGNSSTEGYVEAFDVTNGQWSGICANSFDILDAHIICSMLGFPTAIAALANGAAADLYGTAPSGTNFVLDNLGCTGKESSVFHCLVTDEVTEICGASQIAGVKCATSKLWSEDLTVQAALKDQKHCKS